MVAKHWHEYWASGGAAERALGDPSERTFLATHWRKTFSDYAATNAIVVDIACGDGVIFSFAREELRQSTLIALDASEAGVRAAMRATPGAMGAASDACRLPVRSGAADIVVSQFGLEYGGAAAFQEAARILKPGGALSVIAHLKDGSINAECAENLRLLNLFFKEGLADHARESLASSYAQRYARAVTLDRSEKKFQQAARRISTALESARDSVAKTTLSSALNEITALASRRMAYDSTEAFTFIDQVKTSLKHYRDRMRTMVGAALDQPAVDRAAGMLTSSGLIDVAAESIAFRAGGSPGAWRIQARRA